MTRLIYLDTLPLNDESIFNRFYNTVSEYRQNKINAYKNRKDKNVSLGAGILLEYSLESLGLCEKNMMYKEGKYGKPYFENKPDIHFNISHSDIYVLLAVSESEVGCDIEKTDGIDLKIAKRFFSTEEYSAISSLHNTDEQKRLFYRYWTLKESFIKATGYGMNLPLNRFCISFAGNEVLVNCSDINEQYTFFEYNEIENFCVSCCINGKEEKPELVCKNELIF